MNLLYTTNLALKLSLNQLTFDVDFCVCVSHNHSSPEIERQGHKLR